MQKNWDKALPPIEIWRECLRVLKPGAFAFIMSIPRQDCQARMITSLEEAGFKVGFTPIYWTYATGFPKALNVGKKTGFKELTGSYAGFSPKPALEVILCVMKPLSEKTYVEQAMKNGKGVSWLDDCRVSTSYGEEGGWGEGLPVGDIRNNSLHVREDGEGWEKHHHPTLTRNPPHSQGRFPANLLVSDNVLDRGEYKCAAASVRHNRKRNEENVYGAGKGIPQCDLNSPHNDSGDYSRFFSLDAWDEKMRRIFPFIEVPKPSKGEKNAGLEGFEEVESRYGAGGGAMPSGNDNPNKTSMKNHRPVSPPS